MQKKLTLILNVLLSICLLFTMIPTSAFASPASPDNVTSESEQVNPDNTDTPEPEPEPEPVPEPLVISGAMYKTDYASISWKSDDAAATYNVYRSTKKTSGFKKIGSISKKEGAVKFNDTKKKLTLGTTYYYKVDKVVNKEALQTSNTVSVKIQILPVKNVKAALASSNDVKLTWSKATHATYYTIYRSTSSNGKYTKLASVSKTTYTDKSTADGKAYYYRIFARKKGVAANSISSETIAAYTKTLKPTVSAKYTSDGVTLSWKKLSGASLYYVYKMNGENSSTVIARTSSLSFTDTDVEPNKSYTYVVRGVYRADGKSIGGAYSAKKRIYTGKIDPNKKMVALTFDDGPSIYTTEIVDCLNKYGGHATFFVVGNRVNTYKKQLKYAFDSGNEIANHTYTHPTLTKLSTSKINSEISKTDNAIKNITGVAPALVRAPGGATNSTVRKTIKKPFIYWSIDTLDWKHRNSKTTVNTVMKNVKDGDIILLHDIHKATKTAALELIPKLQKAGYQLVTVSELAEYRGYNLKNGTTYYSFR